MRILLCGDNENALVQLGCELRDISPDVTAAVLVSGTTQGSYRVREREVSGVAVHRAERADLYPTHWHKSVSVDVRKTFRNLLGEPGFDLVHVLSWRGLTRDLVTTANTMGVPAVVSLQDDWTTCLLDERVQPDDREAQTACTLRHSVAACLPCARGTKPSTKWVPIEAEFLAFTERANAVKAELESAAAIFTDSQEASLRLCRLGDALVEREVIVNNRNHEGLVGVYERVVTAHQEAGSVPGEQIWYEERMQTFAEQEWDKQCREAGA